MANPSISVSDELLNEFDDAIWEAKRSGQLERSVSRSDVIRELMRLWLRGQGYDTQIVNHDIVAHLTVPDSGVNFGFDDQSSDDP